MCFGCLVRVSENLKFLYCALIFIWNLPVSALHENLSVGEGGGGGRSTKKVFAQGKFKWKQIHARQLTLQNIHATVWKIHTRNLLTKKNSCDSKIPHPSPTTFLMVRPWIGKTVNTSIVLQEKSQSGVNQFVVLWPVFCCDGRVCVYICTYIRRQVECTLYWG